MLVRRRCSAPGRRLEQLGDERGPAGLVAGAESSPGIAVEVLEEERVVVRVAGRTRRAEHRSTPVLVAE